MHRDQDVAVFSARSGAGRRLVAGADGRRPSLRLYQEAQRLGDLVKDVTALTLQLFHLLWSTRRRTLSGRVSRDAALSSELSIQPSAVRRIGSAGTEPAEQRGRSSAQVFGNHPDS
jgi:hypothetical protein